MNTKLLGAVFGVVFALLSAGCNDAWVGETEATTETGTGGGTTGTTKTLVNPALTIDVSNTQMGTSPSESVSFTVTLTDNYVAAAGFDVSFTASSGKLVLTSSTTDANGQLKGTLSPGGDQSNRTITITATAGTATDSADIVLQGTTVTLTGPQSVAFGDTGIFSIVAKDSALGLIPNATITVASKTSNGLNPASVVTNTSGTGTLALTATTVGADTLTATGLGVTATHDLSVPSDSFVVKVPATAIVNTCVSASATWLAGGVVKAGVPVQFSATRGAFYTGADCLTAAAIPFVATTDATGTARAYLKSTSFGPSTVTAMDPSGTPSNTASLSFLATDPAVFMFNSDFTTIAVSGSALLTVKVTDAFQNAVANVPVTFNIAVDASGGSLSSSTAMTDVNGVATVTYNATTQSSIKNGVEIQATVAGTTPETQSVFITVGGQATGLTIGMSDMIAADSSNTMYIWKGSVTVTDSGNAGVEGWPVTLTVRPVAYDKGQRRYYEGLGWVAESSVKYGFIKAPGSKQTLPCMNEDTNLSSGLDTYEQDFDGVPIEDLNCNGALEVYTEDYNKDGYFDPGEDANCNGLLDVGEDKNANYLLERGEDTYICNGVQDLIFTEDLNGNGTLDVSEDTNGNCIHDEDYNLNGSLEPGPGVSVNQYSTTTDANGEVFFELRYKKDHAHWVEALVTATASILGTDSTVTTQRVLWALAADVSSKDKAPPGLVSDFGTGRYCADKN